jgi:hypothetical protein
LESILNIKSIGDTKVKITVESSQDVINGYEIGLSSCYPGSHGSVEICSVKDGLVSFTNLSESQIIINENPIGSFEYWELKFDSYPVTFFLEFC